MPSEGENQEERKDKKVTFPVTGWTGITGPDRSAQGCCRRLMGKHCPRGTRSAVLRGMTGAQGAGEAVPGCAGLTGMWDSRKQRQTQSLSTREGKSKSVSHSPPFSTF